MPRTLDDWDGWQFDDPERGEGLVIAFRSESPSGEARPPLRGSAHTGRGQRFSVMELVEGLPAGGFAAETLGGVGTTALLGAPNGVAAWKYSIDAH